MFYVLALIIEDADEIRSHPNIVAAKISAITRTTNKHDWTKYTEVFEKTVNSWSQGVFTPDIRELIPDSGMNRMNALFIEMN